MYQAAERCYLDNIECIYRAMGSSLEPGHVGLIMDCKAQFGANATTQIRVLTWRPLSLPGLDIGKRLKLGR